MAGPRTLPLVLAALAAAACLPASSELERNRGRTPRWPEKPAASIYPAYQPDTIPLPPMDGVWRTDTLRAADVRGLVRELFLGPDSHATLRTEVLGKGPVEQPATWYLEDNELVVKFTRPDGTPTGERVRFTAFPDSLTPLWWKVEMYGTAGPGRFYRQH